MCCSEGEAPDASGRIEPRDGSLVGVPLGYSDSDVLMVKSAQDRQGEHTPYSLGVAPDRRVLVQR
jgi:hypothetical protein